MKRISLFLSTLFVTLLLVTCGKEPVIPVTTITVEGQEPTFLFTDGQVCAVFEATCSYDGAIDSLAVQLASDQEMSDASDYVMTMTETCYRATVDSLQAESNYYYRYVVYYGMDHPFLTEPQMLTTPLMPNLDLPMVNTLPAENVLSTSVDCYGEVISEGASAVIERGICWGLEDAPTIEGDHLPDPAYDTLLVNDTMYMISLTDLTPNTLYYVRAYAFNSHGIGYGETIQVMTDSLSVEGLPQLITLTVLNITATSALGGGHVTDEGASSVTERGICWSTNHEPSLEDAHGNNGIGSGTFTVPMTGLTDGTTYYVRAYAINEQGIAFGDETSFVATDGLPVVVTGEVTDVTTTSATCHGEVTDQGNTNITACGFCWSWSGDPSLNDNYIEAAHPGLGEFTCVLVDLLPGTTYHVRTFATNDKGTTYGESLSFTTQAILTPPTVTTSPITAITETTAMGGGNVTSDGGDAVTERGICWSISLNPTYYGSHAASLTAGVGAYTVLMTELDPGTTYYVRAYAINSKGVSYGSVMSFTTLSDMSLPTVVTNTVLNVTQNTATAGGIVTSDGGNPVTERGVCWSTQHNPTTDYTHMIASSVGHGAFTVTLEGLLPGTTYYLRAYAKNVVGTAYGEEVSFTTMPYVTLPVVAITDIPNVTETSAQVTIEVVNDGGGVLVESGVCWSLYANPTTSGSHVAAPSNETGSYTLTMTGLTPGTTYHIRAYAVNSVGVAYSNEMLLTTQSTPTLPTVMTLEVTDIEQSSAVGRGAVTDDGGATVTERGVCWSERENPNINNNHVSCGSGMGDFYGTMTELSPGVTYYVRAYATNSAGTAYGASVQFTIEPVE